MQFFHRLVTEQFAQIKKPFFWIQSTYLVSSISVCTCVMCMYPGVSLYVPVYVSWSISCLREGTSARSLGRPFARLPQTSQMCIGNTVTKNEIRSQINFQLSIGSQEAQLGFQRSTWGITWIMEDWDRSLLTGLSPGKGCGELFVLLLNRILISILPYIHRIIAESNIF